MEERSAVTVAAETDQGSAHLESLLMTRMRAPFSSFSRWLSDLSSVRIWDSRREKRTFSQSFITQERVCGINRLFTVWRLRCKAQRYSNATATLPGWSLWDKIPSVPLLWRFSGGVVDMHYSAPSCRWPSRGGQDARRTWGQRQKLRDPSLKSGSWGSSEAGTKNSTWLKYLPSNKQQSAANCNTVLLKAAIGQKHR